MADNYVQSNNATGAPNTATAALAGVVAGNAIVAFFFDGSASPTSFTVSDAQGSYTAKGSLISDATNNVYAKAFILENANAGAHSITGTSDTGGSVCIVVVEVGTTVNPSFSGVNGAEQNNPGTVGDTLSSGSVTVTGAATLIAISTDTSSVTGSDEPATGTGFTTRVNTTNSVIGAWRLESKAVAANAAGTFTAVTGTHRFETLAMAILNSAGGAATIIDENEWNALEPQTNPLLISRW